MKVYYLNWQANDQAFKVFLNPKRNIFLPELYRMHDYDFLDEAKGPEDVYCWLNQDNRPNGQTERSLSVGDVIDFNGTCYMVNEIGFIKVIHSSVQHEKGKNYLLKKIGEVVPNDGYVSLSDNAAEINIKGMRYKITVEPLGLVEEVKE